MAAVVGMVMWIAYRRLKWLITAESWSTLADVYAATVGTLFAGLAFAGIIWTITLQRRELVLQRGELKRSANAQEASEAALQAQVAAAQLAARLNALSSLLNSVNEDLAFYGHATASLPHRTRLLEEQFNLREKIGLVLAQLEREVPDENPRVG